MEDFDQNPFGEFGKSEDPSLDLKIHIRIQKRNARKSVTTVAGLSNFEQIQPKKLISMLRKKLCCNGHQTKDKDDLPVIQVQGDHRDEISKILTEKYGIKSKNIIKHGF